MIKVMAGTGSTREKKHAVVVADRKLALLLLGRWKHGTDYELRVAVSPRGC